MKNVDSGGGQGGGLSPGKLRTILLGAKRKSNQEEGLRSNFTSRSHSSSSSSPQIHDAGICFSTRLLGSSHY